MNNSNQLQECRIAVVIPTYNNCETIQHTVQTACDVAEHIIVVNDGATDNTAELITEVESITIVTHSRNMGKGAAIFSGLAKAKDMGFTHAITMDGDGQHLSENLPAFIRAIHDNPAAFVIGRRDLSGLGRPTKSRLLRFNSNFWTWLETGQWVHDTQSGFRAYPLEATLDLKCACRKYDLEVEVLVRGIWAGISVVDIPVSVKYGQGSKSHFRPLRDFALVSKLNCRLLAERMFLPKYLRSVAKNRPTGMATSLRIVGKSLGNEITKGCELPLRFSLSIGIGVMCGILPIWGFQIAAALLISHLMKLNKIIAVGASNISFPAMIPVILYVSVRCGQVVLGQPASIRLEELSLTPANVWDCAVVYLAGSITLAMLAGLTAMIGAIPVACAVKRLFRKRP